MAFRWNDWNIEHVARHGVDPDEAEEVVIQARTPYPMARPDDKFLVWGPGRAGRLLQVVFILDDDGTAFVIHARPLTDAEKRIPEETPMTKTRRRQAKAFERMTTDELQAATAEFGREMVAGSFGALSPKAKARWKRARQKPGRPREGQGAKQISVTVERSLLARSDALARNMGVTRAGMIARGLKAVLAAEGKL